MKALNILYLTRLGRPILLPFSQALLLPLVLPERAATIAVVLVRVELLVLISLLRLVLYY